MYLARPSYGSLFLKKNPYSLKIFEMYTSTKHGGEYLNVLD